MDELNRTRAQRDDYRRWAERIEAALVRAGREIDTLRARAERAERLAELTAEQVAANAQIIVEERRLRRSVEAAMQRVQPVLEAARVWRDDHPGEFGCDLFAAVDTYETQTQEGTDG